MEENARVDRVLKAIGKLQLDDLEPLACALWLKRPEVANAVADQGISKIAPADGPA